MGLIASRKGLLIESKKRYLDVKISVKLFDKPDFDSEIKRDRGPCYF